MTMLGGIGTLWGPVLGAFIYIPASDLILFQFGSTTIHLAILGSLMTVILLFLPQGILPTISDWLEKRRAPRAAHAGARTMAEMHKEKLAPNSDAFTDESSAMVIQK
jgi:branched-chain amino acid transport system permease protein